ncbi:hypothetical protein FDZ58_01310 [Ehrlichia ruminantium]|uniref:hypothetical protein n=1 Tax=Ehrlichia ruminantium TaxID=779 RepID=UPI0015DCDB39|nr:hypothetical protein [Ehrlichia ruminantium]QLK50313.1 hypothetical protein FDZ68_01310 [Ehrlichia ruminantium]QLK51237.1 hypothetical protein FDZ66_01315 [Ehrlichia ruminantium]QLK57655.1 hypothetical protein FDZ59_01305 [Ehrlichia ruminantium]QLK58574.1 hypothetical protein FDZ58_01310 [Ehrlichia ruminantium]UOD98116.1 hypothetical protein IMW64_01310 [Ehrlichia ruminantium]
MFTKRGLIFLGVCCATIVVYLILYRVLRLVFHKEIVEISTFENNLLKIINSADTTIRKAGSSINPVCFVIDDVEVEKQQLIDKFNYYQQGQDDPLVKKHMDYIEANKSYNNKDEDDKTIRAIMGAALESIIMQDVDAKPNMCLIHHAINYIYSDGYKCSLLQIIDEVTAYVRDKQGGLPTPYLLDDTNEIIPKILVKYRSKELRNELNIELTFQVPMLLAGADGQYGRKEVCTCMRFAILPKGKYGTKVFYSLAKSLPSSKVSHVHTVDMFFPLEPEEDAYCVQQGKDIPLVQYCRNE